MVEVVDRKAGWRLFSSLKRQSLESDLKSKLRTLTVKAGQRLVLTCPAYVCAAFGLILSVNKVTGKGRTLL